MSSHEEPLSSTLPLRPPPLPSGRTGKPPHPTYPSPLHLPPRFPFPPSTALVGICSRSSRALPEVRVLAPYLGGHVPGPLTAPSPPGVQSRGAVRGADSGAGGLAAANWGPGAVRGADADAAGPGAGEQVGRPAPRSWARPLCCPRRRCGRGEAAPEALHCRIPGCRCPCNGPVYL